MATSTSDPATTSSTTPPLRAPIVICGPSGSGKSTILQRLFAAYPTQLGYSISHTTRAPRPGDLNGREYHFVTRDAFTDLVARGAFLEHATFGGNLYGTTFGAIEAVAAAGRTCVLDIETEGVRQLRGHETLGRAARVLFLRPPGLDVLERRLRGRGTDGEEDVRRRLEQAEREMALADEDRRSQGGLFDADVTNDELEVCWQEVRAWVAETLAGAEVQGET